ncbi:hypothetical protein GCM10009430_02950 [Aquimarina litoralis]|uniref:eCIS core domain-containing protein n=1 Tax=Aquimarina litoralis TaxID=584605 RepID=A0ABN1IG10_9FLAO
MKTPQESIQEPQKETVQRVQQESSTGGEATMLDNRPFVAIQRKLKSAMGSVDNNPIQRKANHTGLPDTLKSGIENLSGYRMDDVKVHYNSSKPAQLHAHAYAQGTDIHIAPGQEKHLPHEAWHVVQQKQGRVKPTRQLKSKVNINDDVGLEKEADVMGAKAIKHWQPRGKTIHQNHNTNQSILQLQAFDTEIDVNKLNIIGEKHKSSDKRRTAEEKYVKEYLKIQYWKENQLRHQLETDQRFVYKYHYGDSPSLLILDRLSMVSGILYEFTNDHENVNINLKARAKGEQFLIDSTDYIQTNFELMKNEEPDSVMDIKSKNLYRNVAKLNLQLEILKDGLKKKGSENELVQEDMEQLLLNIEKVINHKSVVVTESDEKITGVYIFKNQKTFQDDADSFSRRRGRHMQQFAETYGDQLPGVWKVGDAHIQQIQDYENELDEDYERTNYTLIRKATFDKKFGNIDRMKRGDFDMFKFKIGTKKNSNNRMNF